jgi:hypothetical protein
MNVIVRRDDKHVMTVKENDDSGWSSDGIVLWLESKCKIEMWLSDEKSCQD